MKVSTRARHDLDILVIEDDAMFRDQIVKLLGVYNDITEAASISEAQRLLQEKRFDVVLLDKRLPDGDGLSLIPEIALKSPQTSVIVLTGDNNLNHVQKCLDAGASDYLFKSENPVLDLLVRIPNAMSRKVLEVRSAAMTEKIKELFRHEIVGSSAPIAELRSVVQSLKGTMTSVLITGESGTGKELIARRLNAIEDQMGGRPFEAINCGAIPENLIESELFGHVKGAFTGALQNQVGKFQLADGGDIFLDEVGDLPMPAQVKLLRVLQEGEFSPVGDKRLFRVSVRVIAATNKPLEELVAQGKFREDLYFRLAVFPIKTVPLRERTEDIGDLAQFFLLRFADSRFKVSPEALKHLQRQTWPGNIRELSNAVERAVINAKRRSSAIIEKSDLAILASSQSLKPTIPGLPKTRTDVTPSGYQEFMVNMEREYLRAALAQFNNSLLDLAPHLGISNATLFRRASALGLRDEAPQTIPRGLKSLDRLAAKLRGDSEVKL